LHKNPKKTGILSNPFRVDIGGNPRPQGCLDRQPWAVLSNPFGVKTERFNLILVQTDMELETEMPDAQPCQSTAESPIGCHAGGAGHFGAKQQLNGRRKRTSAAKYPRARACHPTVIRMSEVQPRPLLWLWKNWLPLGKLTLLDGDPGQAKSMLLVDLAARVSSGRAMPDETPGIEGDVTFLAPEDGLRDTLLPRLQAAGANLTRVHVLKESHGSGRRPLQWNRDLAHLEKHLRATESRLLIVERVLPEMDRGVLYRLADLAERVHCAVIVTRFLNKYASGKAIYRGAGGMAAIGAARSAILVAPQPSSPLPSGGVPLDTGTGVRGCVRGSIRILASTKNNLGPRPDSLRFSVEMSPGGVPRLHWLGASPLTADDLLVLDSAAEGKGAATQAEKFLKDFLKDGPMAAHLCYADATKQNISETSLRRAKIRLGIVHNQPHNLLGLFVPATWELPHAHDSRSDNTGVPLDTGTPVETSGPKS
jgi:hypothetical protein